MNILWTKNLLIQIFQKHIFHYWTLSLIKIEFSLGILTNAILVCTKKCIYVSVIAVNYETNSNINMHSTKMKISNPSIRSGVEELHVIIEALLRKVAAEEDGTAPTEEQPFLHLEDVIKAYPETEVSAAKKQVTEKLVVPTDKIRFVAGTGFRNSNRLERDYEVIVLLPDRGREEILIKGPLDQVTRCKEDIMNNLPWIRDFHVEKRYIREFRNRTIEDIEFKYDVNIAFDRETVLISGKKRGCDEAVKAFKSVIEKFKEQDEQEGAPVAKNRQEAPVAKKRQEAPVAKNPQEVPVASEVLIVPANKMRVVTGAGYANRDRMEREYQVQVILPPKGGDEVLIKGSAEQIEKCKMDIMDRLRRCC